MIWTSRDRLGWARTALVLCLLVACDPGGTYRVPGATVVTYDGVRVFELVGASQTTLHASASWFTGSLSVTLSITNKGATPLLVAPDRFHVTDRRGTLAPYSPDRPPRCAGHDRDASVTLTPGATCWMFAEFEVHPDRDRLRTVVLTHGGVRRDGVAVPVSVRFELE